MIELYNEKLETVFNDVDYTSLVRKLAKYKHLMVEYDKLPDSQLFTRQDLAKILTANDFNRTHGVKPARVETYDVIDNYGRTVTGRRYFYSKKEINKVLQVKIKRCLEKNFSCGKYDIETRIRNTMEKIDDLSKELEQLQNKLETKKVFFDKWS